jgi:hypothetical protein
VTCSPHHNHQDTDEYEVATQLWFDQVLKKSFKFPKTPKSEIKLNAANGIPKFTVTPDNSKEILSVEIYYTQNGQPDGEKIDMTNTKSKHWHLAKAKPVNGSWVAELPLYTLENPLWAYANVLYKLDQPVSGAGYYYGLYTANQYNLSSLVKLVSSQQLKSARCQVTYPTTSIIENFDKKWEKEWFNYRPEVWGMKTHKIYATPYQPKAQQSLMIELRSEKKQKIVVGIDDFATEIELNGSNQWQTFVLKPRDFKNAKAENKNDWSSVKELRIIGKDTLKWRKGGKTERVQLGQDWSGAPPQFKVIKWTD